MKLNKKSKDELRKQIEEQLESVPEGQRIHLDKDLLEELLFETFTYSEKDNKIFKMPVWFGKFLRKIDLSEVSFEDVSWSVNGTYCLREEEVMFDADDSIKDDIYKTLEEIYTKYSDEKGNVVVDYSNTNAVIDFTKSAEYKFDKVLYLLMCDFSEVDLSNNNFINGDFESISVWFCNLSNCKLSLSGIKYPQEKISSMKYGFRFVGTNLSNNDLSNLNLKSDDILNEDDGCFEYFDILTNTGINFEFNFDELKREEEETKSSAYASKLDFFRELLPNISGCYINGKRVLSEAEKKAIAAQKRIEYGLFENEYTEQILNGIDEQIGGKTK